jgi:hypothetical protein
MQIDFHHATTYALARLAGFDHAHADVVAYCSQYVDDAVDADAIEFSNGAMVGRIASAHKMLDYRNFEALADHFAWVPFHFLPGNGGLGAGQDPEGSFIHKLVCTPDSPVAHDMLRLVIADRHSPHGLHRLGIAMHTYADTWAHQGFAGVRHEINNSSDIVDENKAPAHAMMDRVKKFFVDRVMPLGHGTVLGHPDRPYLVWGYKNGLGVHVERDNPKEFLAASDAMVRAMQKFIAGDWRAEVKGLEARDRDVLSSLFSGVVEEDADVRHRAWVEAIARGDFSFGAQQIDYVGEGEGSWQHLALGAVDEPDGGYVYSPKFLTSHWKRFHDALQIQRLDIISRVLPAYGICVA